jgi:hypothetical protein
MFFWRQFCFLISLHFVYDVFVSFKWFHVMCWMICLCFLMIVFMFLKWLSHIFWDCCGVFGMCFVCVCFLNEIELMKIVQKHSQKNHRKIKIVHKIYEIFMRCQKSCLFIKKQKTMRCQKSCLFIKKQKMFKMFYVFSDVFECCLICFMIFVCFYFCHFFGHVFL